MKPAVSVGWGGNLHLLSSPVGPRTVAQTLVNSPGEGAGQYTNIVNEWEASNTPGSFSNYYDSIFGGPTSTLPAAYSNHKPGVFYYGQFYYFTHSVNHRGNFHLLRFDGSGIFAQTADGDAFDNKSHSGRGVDFLSPSGTSDLSMGSMSCLVHNGSVFWVGAARTHDFNPVTTTWKTKGGWNVGPELDIRDTGDDAGFGTPRRRLYMSFALTKADIDSKEGRNFGQATVLYRRNPVSGLALDYESLNACDAISWQDDIIYANNVDIVQFLGGSGRARFIEVGSSPSSKCLEPYPSGGFNQVTGDAIGPTQLMVLEGSGVLKKINFPGDPEYIAGVPFGAELFDDPQPIESGKPFGTNSLINIGQLVSDFTGPKVRTLGSRARTISLTAEPDRSCFLKTFNKRLHAFFISAVSGYYHFVCTGDPRNINNWQDRTASVPNAIKLFDGCVFGFRDDDFGTLNIMHTAWSNIGAFGSVGGDRGNGGWATYQLNTDLEWRKLYFGAASTAPVGLIPYSPHAIFAGVPSGTSPGPAPGNPEVIPSTDYALVNYSLYTPRAPDATVNIRIEYTINNGVTWRTATRFRDYDTGTPLGDGVTNLQASPFGTSHTFYWAHVVDLGFNFNRAARVRIVPELAR